MKQKVLLVEDDNDISELIKMHMEDIGLEVDCVSSGVDGVNRALSGNYSLIMLDLMLPGMNGHEVCRRIRGKDQDVLILMLTLKSELVDKVLGLELGADDYLTKPFSIQELQARVKALLRRGERQTAGSARGSQAILEIGAMHIDRSRRRVSVSGQEVELTPKQFDLLCFLAKSPGKPYSRQDLLAWVWGYESSGYEHTVDTHINRLRSKIEPDPAKPQYILTVWGVGYRFVEPQDLK